MNIIDHRILIPASPEVIWTAVGNIQRLPEWQVNCKNIALLTSPQSAPGPGMRWRYTTIKNKDIVIMITAWYDRLGYEYTYVDGSPLKSTKGQIRLQETAEGTIVQWTFQYESTGMLSGLRGIRRSIENEIVDSLRELYRLLVRERNPEYRESRSSVREAPDVSQRAKYKSPAQLETDENPAINIEDDTRPRGVEIEHDQQEEIEPVKSESDSMFAPPPDYKDVITVSEDIGKDDQDTFSDEVTPATVAEDYPSVELTSEASKRDTSQISVFELFGLQKPSDTREIQRDVVNQAIEEELEESSQEKVRNIDFRSKSGLRSRLRRKNINLRV